MSANFLQTIVSRMTNPANIPSSQSDALHYLNTSAPSETVNDFVGAMGKIAKQVIYQGIYTRESNPFYRFWRPPLEAGETIESLFINPGVGSTPAWNDNGSKMFSKSANDIRTSYENINFEMQWKCSTSVNQARTAFLSMGGVERLQQGIISSLRSSAEYAFYIQSLELFSTLGLKGYFKNKVTSKPADATSAAAFLKTLKQVVREFKRYSNLNNKEGVLTSTDPQSIVVLIRGSALDNISIDLLSGVFNLDQIDTNYTFIEVPENSSFGTLMDDTNTIAIVLDEKMVRIFPQFFEGTAAWNPVSFVTNNFLTTRMAFTGCPFFNGVILTAGVDLACTGDGNVTISDATPKYGDSVSLSMVSWSGYNVKVYAQGQKKMLTSSVTTETVVGEAYTIPETDNNGNLVLTSYTTVIDPKAVLIATLTADGSFTQPNSNTYVERVSV